MGPSKTGSDNQILFSHRDSKVQNLDLIPDLQLIKKSLSKQQNAFILCLTHNNIKFYQNECFIKKFAVTALLVRVVVPSQGTTTLINKVQRNDFLTCLLVII